MVPFQILPDRSNERCKYFGREIKKFYFGLTEPSLANVNAYIAVSFFFKSIGDQTFISTVIQMMGDKEFWHGIHRTLVTRSSFKDAGPTYLYRFDIDSKRGNYSKMFFAGKNLKGLDGACHGDDCFYLFKNAIASKLHETSKEFQAMDRMVNVDVDVINKNVCNGHIFV